MSDLVPSQTPPPHPQERLVFETEDEGVVGRIFDRALAVQRPLVLAHLRSIRLRHPDDTPEQLIRRLERRYLAGVTSGGAAVGAAAVVPGVGTGISLGLAGAETVGFLEATALFSQSVAEVHGITVTSPERARVLVMALLMGEEGLSLVEQLTAQLTGKGVPIGTHLGSLVNSAIPRALVGPLTDQLRKRFVHYFATRAGTSIAGRALPFGVGAAIGGAGNHILGRRVVRSSRDAFGAPPIGFPTDVDPKPGAKRWDQHVTGGARKAITAPRRMLRKSPKTDEAKTVQIPDESA